MGVCVFLLNIYRINGLLAKLFAVYGFCHIKLVYFVRRLELQEYTFGCLYFMYSYKPSNRRLKSNWKLSHLVLHFVGSP